MAQGENIIPIPGTKRRKYLENNAGAVDVDLSPSDLKDIEDLLAKYPDTGARYPQAMMSPRNFARVFLRETGITPAKYIEKLRLETARRRLEETHLTLDEISDECGVGNADSLRRLFIRHMNASIINFSHMNAAKKAVILGDMFELGDQSQQEHQKIVDLLDKSAFDKVILVGERFGAIPSDFIKIADTASLIAYIEKEQLSGYTVLVKGSHGMRLDKCVDQL